MIIVLAPVRPGNAQRGAASLLPGGPRGDTVGRRLRGRLEPLYCGGETRAASVFNGLLAARDAIDDGDWVLVHDAVRPCLAPEVLERLIAALRDEQTGGLLALPVVGTLEAGDAEAYVVRAGAGR